MPATHRNRLVTEISNTPGTTGSLTISSASSGYRTFGSGDDGLSFDIVISEGAAWEVRTGCVYTSSGTSLARGTLEDSSTGSAIAFTAAAVITQTPSATWGNKLELQLDRAFTSITNDGSTTQSITGATNTKVSNALTTVLQNPYTWWDTTNKRFAPQRAGNYLVIGSLQKAATVAQLQASIYLNGVNAVSGTYGAAVANNVATVSGVVLCNGSTDYIELYAYTSATANIGASVNNNISFTYLGP